MVDHAGELVEPMGFEFTNYTERKEFCGAAWPSKSLKGKNRNRHRPSIAPEIAAFGRKPTDQIVREAMLCDSLKGTARYNIRPASITLDPSLPLAA